MNVFLYLYDLIACCFKTLWSHSSYGAAFTTPPPPPHPLLIATTQLFDFQTNLWLLSLLWRVVCNDIRTGSTLSLYWSLTMWHLQLPPPPFLLGIQWVSSGWLWFALFYCCILKRWPWWVGSLWQRRTGWSQVNFLYLWSESFHPSLWLLLCHWISLLLFDKMLYSIKQLHLECYASDLSSLQVV